MKADAPEEIRRRGHPVSVPGGKLFRKYVLAFVGLVGAVLAVNGALDAWFAFGQAKEAAVRLQAEKAEAAAERIELFVAEIERQIGWTTHAQWAAGTVEQRRFDYVRLLRQVPAITELVQLDAEGREQLKVSRLAMDVVGSGVDHSAEPRFREAVARKIWFSPVYFRKESEPYLTMAVARSGRNAGVTAAEVNLKLIWDVITTIRVGRTGYAFVVDGEGRLIAHPDISLVLRNTDLSGLPQVAAAREAAAARSAVPAPVTVAAPGGPEVLSAFAPANRLGWLVFVELPLREALAPLRGALYQSLGVLAGALGLSALAGMLLARRMVGPIRQLEAGAARLGGGDLGHRIAVRTGDELERLGERFNTMAGKLQESRADLERKVEDRTRELQEALEYQTATSDVLNVISRSPSHVQPVMDTIVSTARKLCQAERAIVWRIEGEWFRPVAFSGMDSTRIDNVADYRLPVGADSVVGRAAQEGGAVQVLEPEADPSLGPSQIALSTSGNICTVMAVPLLRDGKSIGGITVSRTVVAPFSGKQTELLETFADQAVIAIENVRLFDEVQARTGELARSVEELKTLGETGQAVSGTLDLTRVLDLIASRAVTLGPADGCALFRYERSGRAFSLWRATGLDEEHVTAIRNLRIHDDETAMGRALNERRPIIVPALDEAPSWPLRDATVAAGLRTVLIVPLIRAERRFGTLVLFRKEPTPFERRTVDLMQTFANQSVLAIQNARLFREIEEKGRQLAVASQHKSQFLANMSHELRTPLNAVLGYAELLSDGLYGELPDKAKGVLERIQSNGQHLLALINDVLDLSKIEAGQLTLSLDEYALPSLVQSVVAVAEPLAKAKGLALIVEVAERLPVGCGDERRLTQVLLNLVGNAVKFTDAGSVAIAARATDDSFALTVTDTGPGIAPDDQARIFDAFQQVDNTSTRKKGGTGLGLAISKRIVEMHGGSLAVESQPGRGSTFRLILPIRVELFQEAAE